MRKGIIVVLLMLLSPIALGGQVIKSKNTVYSDQFDTWANVHKLEYLHEGNSVYTGAIIGRSYFFSNHRKEYDLAGLTIGREGKVFKFHSEAVRMFGEEEEYTYALMVGLKPVDQVYVEVFHERSTFEIVNTDSLVIANTYGGTFDYYQGGFSWTAGYIRQDIWDIDRDIYILNASLDVWKYLGLISTNRGIMSSETSPMFFSPEEYRRHLAGIYVPIVTPGENFVFRPQIVAGTQFVNNSDSFAYEASLRIKGWFTDKFGIEGQTSYNNVLVDDDPYSNFYGNVTIIWRLH